MLSRSELTLRGLALSGAGVLLRRLDVRDGVLVLNYHRIGDGSGSLLDRGMWSASEDEFDAQVGFLKDNFDVVGPADLASGDVRTGDRCVLITFDDGYRDNFEAAFPILRSHGVGATFFVSTGFIDRPRVAWWDDIAWMVRSSPRGGLPATRWSDPIPFDEPHRHAAVERLLAIFKALPGDQTGQFMDDLGALTGSGRAEGLEKDMWMTWDMLREMKAGGMWIGGHTVNHPILSRLPIEQQELEIAGCAKRIQSELRQPMRWFSYPRGKPDSFNADTRACLRQQGVELAFSYYGGFRRLDDWDPYDVRRVAVEMDVSLHRFRAMTTLPQMFARSGAQQ